MSLASLPENCFQCSICLDVFTDPVSTPCGHNFCRTCLYRHWDDHDLCQCPVCHKRFHPRPEFSTNEVIAELSVQVKKRRLEMHRDMDAPWQVTCDVCTQFKFKALKSCLVCLTSYCEAHLEPHQRVPSLMRHTLVDPVEDLEERVCAKHARILGFFCRDEQACVCLLCCETEHRDHETVPVEEEAAQQRVNIESKQAKIKLMIDDRMEKIKEFTNSSEMSKVKADKEIEDSEKLFSTLTDKLREIQSKMRSNIEVKLKKSQERGHAMIQALQDEVAELQRKHSQLEELSETEDHLQLLQTLQAVNTMSGTKDWSNIKVYPDLCMQTVRRAMSHVIHAFQNELKSLTQIELTRMTQYKESFSFDASTAGAGLVISDCGTHLKYKKTASSPSSSNHSQRFYSPMIFGSKGFTSGRHFWTVQVGLRNDWDVGVAMETVDRTGKVTVTKANGFFALEKMGADYDVENSHRIVIHLCPRPRRVGVYLDYEEGRVSFYNVDEKMHIYSYLGETFTGKLFPYFYLYSRAKRSEALVINSVWYLL
ncbi:E3 ubiquitin-protein ligase TRIM41-like [Cololabis saira]|uniref:E3 ubiquitin-protein ligase TRIM41-like n=1 Tax=Cololabis saira TaxID=129043 RepID=UPI002AD1ECDF|nr:E3 ubiquitin-protein ligase TRIM41-like [Cololabis saira]